MNSTYYIDYREIMQLKVWLQMDERILEKNNSKVCLRVDTYLLHGCMKEKRYHCELFSAKKFNIKSKF